MNNKKTPPPLDAEEKSELYVSILGSLLRNAAALENQTLTLKAVWKICAPDADEAHVLEIFKDMEEQGLIRMRYGKIAPQNKQYYWCISFE